MLMSSFAYDGLDDCDFEAGQLAMAYPQIAGKRVLVTGVTSSFGVDIVRAFAEHGTELVVETSEHSDAIVTVAEMAASAALSLTLFDQPLLAEADILAMARKAIATHGGVDAVINVIPLVPPKPEAAQGMAAIEAHISSLFLKACLVGRVAANRMRLTHTEGVVLNVAAAQTNAGNHRGFHALARATLQTLTKGEAQNWAHEGIRFNAVAPQDAVASGLRGSEHPVFAGEPDVANLALFLATGRGRGLSGITFDSQLG